MSDAEDRPGQAAKRQRCCLAATIAKTAQQGTRQLTAVAIGSQEGTNRLTEAFTA